MADALKEKGNIAFNEGKYNDAITFYTEAIKIDSYSHILYSNRSAAYAAQGKHSKSLKDAEKSININPRWIKGWIRKAHAHENMGKYNEALIAYTKAKEIEPKDETILQLIIACSKKLYIQDTESMVKSILGEEENNENYKKENNENKMIKTVLDCSVPAQKTMEVISSLMQSGDPQDTYEAARHIILNLTICGELFIQELNKSSKKIYPKLVELAINCPSDTEKEKDRQNAIVDAIRSIARCQGEQFYSYFGLISTIDNSILTGMSEIIRIPNPKLQNTIVLVLKEIMRDTDNCQPLVKHIASADFINPLISIIKQDKPADMNLVHSCCYVLGQLCGSEIARAEILGKGALEAVVKIATQKETGLEPSFNLDTLSALSNGTFIGYGSQHEAVDAMLNFRFEDPEVPLKILRMGGVKAIINSITVPTPIHRIIRATIYLGRIADRVLVHETQYRKLYIQQIEFSQAVKLLKLGDIRDSNYYIQNYQKYFSSIKTYTSMIFAGLVSSENSVKQLISSGMLNYIIDLVPKGNVGAIFALSKLAKFPKIAKILLESGEYYKFITNIPIMDDNQDSESCITFGIETLAVLTQYDTSCLDLLKYFVIIDLLIDKCNRVPGRETEISQIIINFGSVKKVPTTLRLSVLIYLDSLIKTKQMSEKIKKAVESTFNAFQTCQPRDRNHEEFKGDNSTKERMKLRQCYLSSCSNIEKGGIKFKKCSRCFVVAYCSSDCQKAHWKIHKPVCIPKK